MSKSVNYFVIIRDGKKTAYDNLWAPLHRELFWGPEAFEEWVVQGEEAEYEPESLSGVVVVNFDTKELQWGSIGDLGMPRVNATHQRLLKQSWPGFTIKWLSEHAMDIIVHGAVESEDVDPPGFDERCDTVAEAAEYFEADSDDEFEVDDDELEDHEEHRAWLTIIDQNGKARHRKLQQVSVDLFSGKKSALQDLAALTAAEIPPEKLVTEGMWFDLPAKEIGFWGGTAARQAFPQAKRHWHRWNVRWAPNGYAEQCRASKTSGQPMTDIEILTEFLPSVLSTERIDLNAVYGLVSSLIGTAGSGLKKMAIKGVGCVVVVLSISILLLGFYMEAMTAAVGGVLVLFAVVTLLFRMITGNLRSRFEGNKRAREEEMSDDRPPCAGSLDTDERRAQIDRLLKACNYPLLSELEPHFPDEPSLEDLMS